VHVGLAGAAAAVSLMAWMGSQQRAALCPMPPLGGVAVRVRVTGPGRLTPGTFRAGWLAPSRGPLRRGGTTVSGQLQASWLGGPQTLKS